MTTDTTPAPPTLTDDLLGRLVDFQAGRDRSCPSCRKYVRRVHTIRGVLYAQPCMCAIWEGDAPAWAEAQR